MYDLLLFYYDAYEVFKNKKVMFYVCLCAPVCILVKDMLLWSISMLSYRGKVTDRLGLYQPGLELIFWGYQSST